MPENSAANIVSKTNWTLADGIISVNGAVVLTGLPDTTTLIDDPNGTGVFIRCVHEKPLARLVFSLGELSGVSRLTFAHRYEPFWMTAKVGTKAGEVQPETQFLLCEREDQSVVLFAPILDGDFRACLQGAGDNGLELVVESNDPSVCTQEAICLFIAAHDNPYLLMEWAAESVMARMQTGRLRRHKHLPDFADQFGWCTWDAFYQEVSQDKVASGLESFRKGGIQLRLLILDDGWQSVRKRPSGETRLTAFAANAKFPGGLAPMVRMAKEEYGVDTFLVWHALNGYWGGVDEDLMAEYDVRPVPRRFAPGILHHRPMMDTQWWGETVGLVSGKAIYRFFQDYHRDLRKQGVDGVKVDTQATIEGIAAGEGGRVRLMRCYHEALEGSVNTHFDGNLINCMSCANDMLYAALNSNITRTSTDFWPNKPESHGEHLYVNALVSLWFGEFVHPDWDMFQSGHEMGEFHAMGRAVSGSPVYVSDKPDTHNFDVLRKLVLQDGSVLRSPFPGRPTRDCLFHDPTKEDVLLKIFNRNESQLPCGVVGVFNAHYNEPGKPPEAGDAVNVDKASLSDVTAPNAVVQKEESMIGSVSPCDVDGMIDSHYAVYRHSTGECRLMELQEQWQIELPALAGDVFTISAIGAGFAPIGLADMYNSGAAIVEGFVETSATQTRFTLWVKGEGRFLAWSKTRPTRLHISGDTLPFTYAEETHLLEFELPSAPIEFTDVTVEWEIA